MIKVGDMVGFKFKDDYHLAIVIDDLGQGYPYGRYTGLLVGGDGDYVLLHEDEQIVRLETQAQVDQWERQKQVEKLMRRTQNERKKS
jgi:hypothetical protein